MNRIVAATANSIRGLKEALATERAVRQEAVALAVALVATPFIARNLWQAAAMISPILLVLAIELLNTAVEKLSDHVTPEQHDAIRYVKDLGSAAVMCGLGIAGMVWLIAIYERFFG